MSFLPLYSQAKTTPFGLSAEKECWKGHPGLWYDKFFDLWQHQNYEDISIKEAYSVVQNRNKQYFLGGKQSWVLSVVHPRNHACNHGHFRKEQENRASANVKVGKQSEIDEAISRQKKLVEAQGGKILELELTSPMVTGLGYSHPIENGFLWHPTLACPFLPGSSLKGLIRAWAECWCGKNADIINTAFGSSATGAGELIFFDALPKNPVQLVAEVMNPHIGKWRLGEASRANAPSDWKSPIPIFYLAIKTGAKFQFALSLRSGKKLAKDDPAITWLQKALDYLGAGAKTGVGFGRFLDVEALEKYETELSDFISAQGKIEREAAAAEAVAPPRAGERAWYGGEPVYIHSVEGDKAWVIFLDQINEDISGLEPDEDVSLSDLTPIRD